MCAKHCLRELNKRQEECSIANQRAPASTRQDAMLTRQQGNQTISDGNEIADLRAHANLFSSSQPERPRQGTQRIDTVIEALLRVTASKRINECSSVRSPNTNKQAQTLNSVNSTSVSSQHDNNSTTQPIHSNAVIRLPVHRHIQHNIFTRTISLCRNHSTLARDSVTPVTSGS